MGSLLPQPLVHRGGHDAALVDGVDHQRGPADRVAGGEDAGHAGHPVVDQRRCRGRRASRPARPRGPSWTTCRKPIAISTRSAGRVNSVPGISFISQPLAPGTQLTSQPCSSRTLAVVAAKLLGQHAPAPLAAFLLRGRGPHDLRPDAARAFRRCSPSGGLGRISNCVTESASWRIDVPTQSLPVSPPPTTMTCLSLAVITGPLPLGWSSPATRRFCWREEVHREVDAAKLGAGHAQRPGWPAPMQRQTASNWRRSSAAVMSRPTSTPDSNCTPSRDHLLQAAVDDVLFRA